MNPLNLAACASDECIISKKELVAIVFDLAEDYDGPLTFERLEFHDIWEQPVHVNWLEPVIHDGQAALILHCRREEE